LVEFTIVSKRRVLLGTNPPIAGVVLEIAASALSEFKHVTQQPTGIALDWEHKGDYVTIVLPEIS
jgi:hypothetical protein